MKIRLDQGALFRELGLLQGIIEKKGTIPILSNVLIEALEEGRLNIVATDLEVGFRSSIEAEVADPGKLAVNARRLNELARKLLPGQVELRYDGSSLHIVSESFRSRLATQDSDQFPTFRQREGKPAALLAADQLTDAVKRVIFAVTSDDPRYALGGALLEWNGDVATIVATDGHRLSLSRRVGQNVSDKEIEKVVVPRKALAELQRLGAEHDGDSYFWLEKSSLFAQFGERELWTTLGETRFPDYRKVIPAGNDKVFEIGVSTFKSAIERVSVLSQENTRQIRLDLGTDLLKISVEQQQLGEAMEEIPIQYSGEPLAIGFNAQYLLDFLNVAGTERVRVSLGREMGQGLFEPVREAGDTRDDKYVVMPMALQ